MSGHGRLSPRRRLVLGALFVVGGLAVIWGTATEPAALNAPVWMGAAIGGMFVAAGVVVATQDTGAARWVGPVGGGLIFLAMAAVANWIAFGPGPRACSGGISFLFFSGSGPAGELECRVAFGFGAVLLNAGLFMGATAGVARLMGPSPLSDGVEKVGHAVFGLALLPLVVLALLFTVAQQAASAAWSRLKGLVGGG